MSSFDIKKLAVPSVCVLITFLAYSSQILFLYIEPSPLDKNELIKFNLLVACIWICYARAWLTDPGRVPPGWKPYGYKERSGKDDDSLFDTIYHRQRWCRRCEAFKPPRAHHCKACQRCVLKMDHHCPWTGNCVSHLTFPHFMRFLFYAVAGISYLEYFLIVRASVVWNNRKMPSYYGPAVGHLIHLFILVIVNSMTLFMLAILLLRSVYMLALNQTTIEGWEIERHKTLVRRAKVLGGFLDGPDGMRIRIRKQEFPYDIGIWENIRDGMGGSNVLAWLFPLSATLPIQTGLEFEVNGFENPSTPWPPPDPDRLPRKPQSLISRPNTLLFPSSSTSTSTSTTTNGFTADSITAFRQRQEADLLRQRSRQHAGQKQGQQQPPRQRPFHERYSHYAAATALDEEEDISDNTGDDDSNESGEEGWRTAEGDRLRDFGVDEDVEFYDYEGEVEVDDGPYRETGGDYDDEDEDDIPLAKLIEKRRIEREKKENNVPIC